MKRLKSRAIAFFVILFLNLQTAQAEPISAALIAIGLSAATAATVTTAIVGAIVGTIVSAGLSLAANMLFSRQRQEPFGSLSGLSREIISNKKSTVEYIPVVYGRHKVGGIQIFEEVSNTKLYLVFIFSEGPINSVETVLIDGVDATDSKFNGLIDVYTFTGEDDQSVTGWNHILGSGAADFIAAGAPGWTANHRARGCSGVAMALSKNARVFPRIPVVTAIIQGKLVYDPRDMNTKYSTNAGLCIRDYEINSRYGGKILSTRIDENSWQDAANFFDQTTDYGNGSQKRFELNGIVHTSQRVWDNIEDLMMACNSLPKRVNGKHGILPLKAETVSFNFNDDNVKGGIKTERLGRRFKKNKVNVSFINPDTNWQADLYTETNASFLAADNDDERTLELELLHVTDRFQSAYTGKIAMKQSRLEEKLRFLASHEALKVEVGDVVDLTHTLYGFSGKELRVTALTLEPDGNVGIQAEEYDADVYTVETVSAGSLGSSTTFDSPFEISPPGTPAVSQTFRKNSAGFVVNIVTLSWSAPASAQIAKYIVEYRLTGESTWIKASEPENTTVDIIDLVAGTYDFAVSAVNTIGRVSDRSTRNSVNIVNNTDTPADVTGFTHAFTSDNQIVLRWAANEDVKQGGGFRIKVSNNTSGAAWSDFPQINVLIDGRETTATLGLIEGTYMIKAENLAGVQSENHQSIEILVPDNDEWVAVSTVTESTAYSGTHTNTEESTGTLTLSASSSGGFFTSGTYDYANQIDLNGTFASRLTRVSSGTLSNTAANWDSFPGNIDDYTNVLIDDMAGRSTVDVRHYFATSTQSSTGPFGTFHELQTAETVGRYLKFQTTIDTEANTENTNIQELAATAWMKRRAESASNVSVSSSGGSVTFNAPFYDAPNIQVFPFNGSAGQFVTASTSQITRTGFDVGYFSSSGGPTAGKVSWAAFGYGKEIT